MTSPSSWYGLARECRMRAAETHALADGMKEAEPKTIMLRIVADYEKLAEWAEELSTLVGQETGKMPFVAEPPKPQPRRKLGKGELRQQTAAAFLAWRAGQTSKKDK